MKSKRERAKARRTLATAHHEAGHAVIALYFGIGVKSVELTPDHAEHLGVCHYHAMRRNPDDMDEEQLLRFVQNQMCIFFSGQLAHARFLGRMPTRYRKQPDMIDALDLALRACRNDAEANHFYAWLFERTRWLVQQAWPTIQFVAKILAQKGRLSGAEVTTAMRASLARSR